MTKPNRLLSLVILFFVTTVNANSIYLQPPASETDVVMGLYTPANPPDSICDWERVNCVTEAIGYDENRNCINFGYPVVPAKNMMLTENWKKPPMPLALAKAGRPVV